MDSFVVSARKYRPDTFMSVVGQGHITNTLKNALKTNQLAHAFLFCGPRGVGKTTCARILAKAVNCESPLADMDPCNQCESCKAFNENRSLCIFELDAASNNGVDDIRHLIEQTRYLPVGGKKSVFIVDEVHMLTTAAFNAFLKTLEEPPAHAIFILATTEKHKILPTVLSRCQKFDFKRIKVDDIAQNLEQIANKESIKYEYEALQLISIRADGGMRDALSIFDQIVNFSQKNVTFQAVQVNLNILDADFYFKLSEVCLKKDHAAAFLILQEIIERGFEPGLFLSGLLEHFRNLLISRDKRTVDILETTGNIKQKYIEQSEIMGENFLVSAFHLLSEAESKQRTAQNPRLAVEITLLRLAHLTEAISLAESGLEKKKS